MDSKGKLLVPPVETHILASEYNDQSYVVRVMQPLREDGRGDERLPVLYVSEGDCLFDAVKGIGYSLQGFVLQPFIIVGIGYSETNPFASAIVRGRDLTWPQRPEIMGVPTESRIAGVPGVAPGQPNWGGAANFLSFLERQLHPFISGRYPVSDDIGYFGHSMGAGFGVFALFHRPDFISRYILSSPGIVWDDCAYGLDVARQKIAAGFDAKARIYLSVAELEEHDPLLERSNIVGAARDLARILKSPSAPNLDLILDEVQGESHNSVWPIAFVRGARALFPHKGSSIFATPAWAKPGTTSDRTA